MYDGFLRVDSRECTHATDPVDVYPVIGTPFSGFEGFDKCQFVDLRDTRQTCLGQGAPMGNTSGRLDRFVVEFPGPLDTMTSGTMRIVNFEP